ncbi:MAG: ribosome-associated translation inhibitor RaiA [Flavobacteriales bacterium]|jgi:ribosome-associated translation inhibitor RaiA
MIIQLNTDKNIAGDERLETYLNTVIKDKLSHFTDHITRVEVHLTDEKNIKKGSEDKRCMIEARLDNRPQPVAVTGHGSTVEKSLSDALDKIKASMDTIVGRLKSH